VRRRRRVRLGLVWQRLHHARKREARQHRSLRADVLAVVGVEVELLLTNLEQLDLEIGLEGALVRIKHGRRLLTACSASSEGKEFLRVRYKLLSRQRNSQRFVLEH